LRQAARFTNCPLPSSIFRIFLKIGRKGPVCRGLSTSGFGKVAAGISATRIEAAMRRNVNLIAALLMAIAAPLSAIATPLSVQLARSGFTPKDLDLMSATAAKLYTPSVKEVGSTLSWSNPDSGARGSVKLAAVQDNCIYLHHFVYAKGRTSPAELRPRMCKSTDGRWLLAP
jgi:surface antigen